MSSHSIIIITINIVAKPPSNAWERQAQPVTGGAAARQNVQASTYKGRSANGHLWQHPPAVPCLLAPGAQPQCSRGLPAAGARWHALRRQLMKVTSRMWVLLRQHRGLPATWRACCGLLNYGQQSCAHMLLLLHFSLPGKGDVALAACICRRCIRGHGRRLGRADKGTLVQRSLDGCLPAAPADASSGACARTTRISS